MSSRLVELFSLRRFDFSTLSASTSMELVVVRQLRVVECVEATLVVRVHAISLVAGTIEVRLTPTSPCSEDPAVSFVAGSPLVTVSISTSVSAPALLAGSAASALGGHLRVSVLGARAGTAGNYRVDMSAALILKE